jgi:hypothetical protein
MVSNPSSAAVVLSSVTDVLPEGFSYIPGSTTGVTTAEASIAGQTLTWKGPFTLGMSDSVMLAFAATAPSTPGTYLNNAGATADGVAVTPSGPTAPINVAVTVTTTTSTTTTTTPCGNGVVDASLGEQCDAGAANGSPSSCCDAVCRFRPAGAVCRVAAAQCEDDAVCDGASAGCPANPPTPDGAPCDDGKPETATSVCQGQQCEGVSVGIQPPPPVVLVPPGTKSAAVGVPVTIQLPGGGGARKTKVVIQGFASCSELPPPPAECTTKLCRKLRKRLAQVCGASTSVVSRLVGVPQIETQLVTVTRKFTRSFGGSRSGSVHTTTRLNPLGGLFFRLNGSLPVQGSAQIRDPQGRSIREIFHTLLQSG